MRKFSKFASWTIAGVVVSILCVWAAPSHSFSSPSLSAGNATAVITSDPPRLLAQDSGRLGIPQEFNQSTLGDFPSRATPRQSADPADQIAPPGLLVQPGSDPISPFFAIRMQKELDNLVGRFESALFLANAADQPVEVSLPSSDAAIASSQDAPLVDGDKSFEAVATTYPVLLEARQLSQDWPSLIEQQAYSEARDRWLKVRQGLWDDFPLDRPYAQTEIRAMWLDRGSIVRAGSRQGLADLFDNMQAAGINTVFFETLNAGFPIYRSRIAPQQNPLTEGWDPLAEAVAIAHERNMELHAWIWTFAAGNLRHNPLIFKSDEFLGPSLSGNPDWAAYDQAGNPIPLGQTKPFYDPANPEVREYLLSLINEIITDYDVDGLQLDYIRYPFQDPYEGRTYGYGTAARRQFRRLTRVDPVQLTPNIDPWLPREERARQRSLWQAWDEFRIEQVTSFVEETSQLIRSRRPDVVLSAAVFAMPEQERLQKIQQDWNTWAERGLVDWIVLMSYAQDANRFSELITPWVLEQKYESTLVIPGIRLLSMPIPVMVDQLQTLRDLPSTGYALFATDNLDNRIQTVLGNTQGTHSGSAPQNNPYVTAAERFKTLQQEWNWLLANGQMVLQPRLADRWLAEVNSAGTSLNDLASGSLTDPQAVIAQIELLKRNIGTGLSLETATTLDYRRNAWKNRLEAINRFLAYGAVKGG